MRDVHGTTATGFEQVREVLAAASLDEGGAAFALVRDGELLVDLWAGAADDGVAWAEDTVSCCYSASKGVLTTCLVLLHHDGLLDLAAPVADYWPEFAANGKATVTVAQLLSHSAGLHTVEGYAGWLGLHGERWDELEAVRARLAAMAPAWEPGTGHGYHGLTYGYLAGALVRRISGMEHPELFRTRLAEPLGLDLAFGLEPSFVARRARQRKAAALPPEVAALLAPVQERARDPRTPVGQAFFAQEGSTVLEHLDVAGSAPAPMTCGAGNGDVLGTARGLARLYAALAEGPQRPSLAAFGTVQRRDRDIVLDVPAAWCIGFMGNAPAPTGELTMGPGEGAFGHHGAGGQLGGVDLDRGVAFGFLRSQLSPVSTVARDLLAAAYRALDA